MIPTYAVAQPRGALAFVASVLVVTVLLVAAGSRLATVVDRRAERQGAAGIRV
jgi:hypothetical protein